MAHYLAYVLIAIGIILLAITFLIGYGLYTSLSEQSSAYAPVPSTQNSSITGSISILTSNLGSTVRTTSYIILQIIILFLFASVGYKIAFIGVKLMNGNEQVPSKQKN
jgi:flagellar basal body-associated protein FliL